MSPLSRTENERANELAARASLRTQFRPTPEQKELLVRAASLTGQTLSDFMRIAIEERANRVIAEHERIILNNQARERFFSALSNPPAPNDKLTALAERYAREVKSRP